MEEFRKFLENEKKIKIEELKYKKYGKDSHRGEAAITVKGKKLVDEALKLHGAVSFSYIADNFKLKQCSSMPEENLTFRFSEKFKKNKVI